MLKKFTLIELLVVIALLGVIAVMVSTNVLGIMNKSRNSLSSTQIDTIENAAEKWGTINADKMPLDDSILEVDIQTLSDEGFIDSASLENPKNGNKLCGVVEIKYNTSKKQYNYNFKEKDC